MWTPNLEPRFAATRVFEGSAPLEDSGRGETVFVLSCTSSGGQVTIAPRSAIPCPPAGPHYAVSGAARSDRAPAGRPGVGPGGRPRTAALALQPPLPPPVLLPARRPVRPVPDADGPPRRPDPRPPPLVLVGPPRRRQRQLLGGAAQHAGWPTNPPGRLGPLSGRPRRGRAGGAHRLVRRPQSPPAPAGADRRLPPARPR